MCPTESVCPYFCGTVVNENNQGILQYVLCDLLFLKKKVHVLCSWKKMYCGMTDCSGLFEDSKRGDGHGFSKWNNCIDSHSADFKGTTLNLGVKVLVYLRKLSVFMSTHKLFPKATGIAPLKQ